MINKILVKEKLEKIKDYYEKLEELLEEPLEEILKSFKSYFAIERVFILIVDEMIDINTHFIRKLNLRTPDDFQSTFSILAEKDIITNDFAKKIAPVVGLRNRLVHRYEEINRALFLNTAQKEKSDFKEYIKGIYQYLEKN